MKNDTISEQIRNMIQKCGPIKLGVMVVCGILLVLLSCGDFAKPQDEINKGETTVESGKEGEVQDELTRYRNTMEEQVETMLSKV